MRELSKEEVLARAKKWWDANRYSEKENYEDPSIDGMWDAFQFMYELMEGKEMPL